MDIISEPLQGLYNLIRKILSLIFILLEFKGKSFDVFEKNNFRFYKTYELNI